MRRAVGPRQAEGGQLGRRILESMSSHPNLRASQWMQLDWQSVLSGASVAHSPRVRKAISAFSSYPDVA